MEWLQHLNPSTAGVLIPLAGILLVIVSVIAKTASETRKAQFRADIERDALALKRDMIERGMSADEIERVLQAGPHGSLDGSRADPLRR